MIQRLLWILLLPAYAAVYAQEWKTYQEEAMLRLEGNELWPAIQLLEKSVQSYAEVYNRNDAQYLSLLTLLGNLTLQSEEPARAESVLAEVIDLTAKLYGQQSAAYAQALNNMGRLYQLEGNFYKAEPMYLKAREIYGAAEGTENEAYALVVNNLATLYYEYGQDRQAEKYYLEAKRVFETAIGRSHPGYGLACNNLGVLFYRKGQYIMAAALLVRALNNRENALGTDHPDYAVTLNNMALLYQVMEQWPKAEEALIQVKDIREKVFGKYHPDYALACNNLAAFYFKTGRKEQADLLLQEAITIFKKVFGHRHPQYITAAINMAVQNEAHGYPERALTFLREAADALLYHVRNNFAYLSEKQRETFYQQLSFHFESFYSFVLRHYQRIPGLLEWAFQNNMATKGMLLKSYQSLEKRITKSNDTSLIELYRSWLQAKRRLTYAETLTSEKQQEKPDIDQLEQQVSRLEKELALRSGAFRDATESSAVTAATVSEKLKPGEALVDLVRIRYHEPLNGFRDSVLYLAFILKPEFKEPKIIVLPEGKKMERQGLTFYRDGIVKTVTSGRKDYRSYSAFWKPMAEVVAGSQTVYVVPDGLYHQINIETLFNPETEKFVIDEVDIRLLGNAADLMAFRSKTTTPQKAFRNYHVHLFGYPDYSGREANGSARDSFGEAEKKVSRFWDETTGTITVLNGTLTEVNKIAALVKATGAQVKVYTGASASEENLKQLTDADVLHIATHGFFWPVDEVTDNLRNMRIIQNPLLRSGLVLANAEAGLKGLLTNNEDGILYAAEVSTLSLENTTLVILSACETGLGEIMNGEGVYGLQRSFYQAGARALLMSLWPVADEATMELMITFYQAFSAGKSKHDALREAKNLIRKKYHHPFYWGAFVLTGE